MDEWGEEDVSGWIREAVERTEDGVDFGRRYAGTVVFAYGSGGLRHGLQ